jgi:hypothetical protein
MFSGAVALYMFGLPGFSSAGRSRRGWKLR